MDEANDAIINPRPKKRNWAPYLLILPSLLYLAVFFAWPMFRALTLAIWEENILLVARDEPRRSGSAVGRLPQGTGIGILDRQGNVVSPEDLGLPNLITDVWFFVRGEDPDGQMVEGWAPESRIRVRAEDEEGAPVAGTVRPKLGATADPLTSLYIEPHDDGEVLGKLDSGVAVEIVELITLELWYLVRGEVDEETLEGWVQSRYIRIFADGVTGRVDRGDSGQLTTKFLQRMVNDRFFRPALWTTLLLMVLIIPVQFVLAIIMALVIQQRLRGNTLFLYIFAIPLAISDLAVGILWYAIFTQSGYLNSILQALGLIQAPVAYLTANTRHWIIIAIFMAEVWRATSIVMVIVVAGLQAIPLEVLEAAEVYGATLWQRVRYITLPLLRPSLQVALILRTLLALQVFAVVIALSGGDIVTVLANEAFRQYYDLRSPNLAATYAGLILLISLVSAFFYLRTLRTQQEVVST